MPPQEFWPERWEATPTEAGKQEGAGGADAGLGPAPTPTGHASNPAKTFLPFSDGETPETAASRWVAAPQQLHEFCLTHITEQHSTHSTAQNTPASAPAHHLNHAQHCLCPALQAPATAWGRTWRSWRPEQVGPSLVWVWSAEQQATGAPWQRRIPASSAGDPPCCCSAGAGPPSQPQRPPPPPSTAALAAILGRFRVSVAPRMGSREDVRAAETMKLTLQCAEGMHLRLEAR